MGIALEARRRDESIGLKRTVERNGLVVLCGAILYPTSRSVLYSWGTGGCVFFFLENLHFWFPKSRSPESLESCTIETSNLPKSCVYL